ncbi:MAG: group I truncated hemoglobin [Luteimonas sp.]
MSLRPHAVALFVAAVAALSPMPGPRAAQASRPGQPDAAPAHPELRDVFRAFGGEAGLAALMDDFVARLVADPRTHRFFADVDQVALKRHLVEQFCAVLGGGCAYTGRDMVEAHAAFGIDRAAFNALVEDLQVAMSARGIPFRAQNRLLAVLAPMHREIINR